MHGKSVSPLMRVRKPQLSVWYQMLSSHGDGVSTVEMKSTASWSTSTMYSLAPMPSNGGISVRRECSVSVDLEAPAGVGEADDAALRLGPLQDRQVPGRPVLERLRAGIVLLLQAQQQRCPAWLDGKPDTSTS